VGLLSPLSEEEQTTFIVVVLPDGVLRKLVGRLGTAPKGTRLDALSVWELADTLVDYYATDAEVAAEVDRTVRRELGPSPLVPALDADGGAAAVTSLLLEARDPLRDLAWALLGAGREEDRALASRLLSAIVSEFDQADERAKSAGQPKSESAAVREAARLARRAEKDAARAENQRERALGRVDDLRTRVVELEKSIAAARKELRDSERAHERATAERDKLAKEREGLRTRLQSGTAAEVERLGEALDTAERRIRALEADVEEGAEREETLTTRLRALEQAGAARPAAAEATAPEPSSGAIWCTPIFTDEFYDSIRRWDRRIVRSTFEKIARLCDDWRHPSLRAIALEGLPGYHRIRIATDVRLIYRPLDGNRLEILSLIDREDLQRYIRHVKGS
jgi:predicted  nucleic acid-binding Zn-ribbon protein